MKQRALWTKSLRPLCPSRTRQRAKLLGMVPQIGKQMVALLTVKNKLVLLVSILEAAENTHPFVPTRLKRLSEYAADQQYSKILSGDYEKDTLGLHESGSRIVCQCGLKVNSKLTFCPECGRELGPPEIAAPTVAAASGEPQESKFDKLKGSAGSFFRRS